MKIILVIIVICCLVLTGCQSGQQSSELTQVIKCKNLIFKCSDKDCANQCGKLMSENNQKVISGLSVNNGKGCECIYLDYN